MTVCSRIFAGLLLTLSAGVGVCAGGPAKRESYPTASAPTVSTSPATAITSVGATLNGSVDPQGASTWVWFEWGTSSSLSTHNHTTATIVTIPGSFSAAISGLLPNTTYYFRAVAQQNGGTEVRGAILQFTTSASSSAPTVVTIGVTALGCTSATVNGSANPNALQTTAWFEWGTDSTLTIYTMTQQVAVGGGTQPVNTSATLNGTVRDNTVYYFRAAAQSSGGTSRGEILSFKTYPRPDSPRRPSPHVPGE